MTESVAEIAVEKTELSEDVLRCLATGDYGRVGRIAQNDPGQFHPRAVTHDDEFGKEYEPLHRWQGRALDTAATLIAGRVAALRGVSRLRGEVEAWDRVVTVVSKSGENSPDEDHRDSLAIVEAWARRELGVARDALAVANAAVTP